MHLPYFELKFRTGSSDDVDEFIDIWEQHTIESREPVNRLTVINGRLWRKAMLWPNKNVFSASVDLIGQQKNHTWSTSLKLKDELVSKGDQSIGKVPAPWATIFPLSGKITVHFKDLDNTKLLTLPITVPYMVPSFYPVDIVTEEWASVYIIHRYVARTLNSNEKNTTAENIWASHQRNNIEVPMYMLKNIMLKDKG